MASTDDQAPRPARKPPAPATPAQRPRFRVNPAWVVAGLVLLAFNIWAGSRATQGEQRVRIPYSPVFLTQVNSGNVAQITSKGTAIQGSFAKPVMDFLYAQSSPAAP